MPGFYNGPTTPPGWSMGTQFIIFSVDYELSAHYVVFLCFALFWNWLILPVFFRVTSLELGKPYGCSSSIEATLKNMSKYITRIHAEYINGLVQERRNSIANALELRLSCTNPSINNG